MSGILSWLRKHFSAEWWRSRCQCLRGDESESKKCDFPMSVQFHDMRSAQLSTGIDNPLFLPPESAVEWGDQPTIEIPTIEVQPPPPPEYSSLERNVDTGQISYIYAPGYDDSLKYHRRSYKAQTKITSRLSITSDYVSDAESDYRHPSHRSSTNGRRSGRRADGKKRRIKHHYSPRASSIRSYTHATSTRNHHSGHKMRKYPTGSLTKDSSIFEPLKPISRRHSIDTPSSSRTEASATNLNLSISIRRNKKPSTARSSVREARNDTINQRHSLSGARPKMNSLPQRPISETPHDIPSCSSTNDSGTLRKSSSLSPIPPKPGGLVRNETILEVPIYIKKPTRPASAHAKLTNSTQKTSSTRHSRHQRKPRHPKPPRSNKLQSSVRGQPIRVPRSEKWLYGYASLPASWNNIEPDKLEQAGLTRESLMESLERLDFEKLCRPVPNITNELLSTPRMSVVQKNMPGEEREILKDTYKLENLDIVTTDL